MLVRAKKKKRLTKGSRDERPVTRCIFSHHRLVSILAIIPAGCVLHNKCGQLSPHHPPPLCSGPPSLPHILFGQSLSLRYCDWVDLCKDCQCFKKQTSLKCLVFLFLIWDLLLRFMPACRKTFIPSTRGFLSVAPTSPTLCINLFLTTPVLRY